MKAYIRDLFWLVIVCSLALGWWLDHRHCVERWRAAAYNYAWASNVLESQGYTQTFKNGRVSDIRRATTP
jgi:hypothetical protein